MAATSSTPSSTRGSTQTRSPRPTAQVSAPRSARRIKTVRAAAAIPVQAACTAAIRRRAFATTSPQGRALRPPTLPPPAADEHGVFRRYLRDTGVGNRRRTRSTAPHPALVSLGLGENRRARHCGDRADWGYRRWGSSPYAEYGSSSRLGLGENRRARHCGVGIPALGIVAVRGVRLLIPPWSRLVGDRSDWGRPR